MLNFRKKTNSYTQRCFLFSGEYVVCRLKTNPCIMRLFFCLFLTVFAASAQRFELTGHAESLREGSFVYLAYQTKGAIRVDSTPVRQGKFAFKGKLEYPTLGVLLARNPATFKNGDDGYSFYLESRSFAVQSPDSLSNLTTKGSPLNDENLELSRTLQSYQNQLEKLDQEFRSVPVKQRGDTAVLHRFQEKENAIRKEGKAVYVVFAEQYPKSFISIISLENVVKDLDDEPELRDRAKAAFQRILLDWRETPQGYNLERQLNDPQKDKLGKQAIDFRQRGHDGRRVSLSDFKGKVVLLDFWASWCKPCRAENPYLVSVYEAYKDKGFTILSVSLDVEKYAWTKAIETDGLTWTHVSDLKGWQNEVAQTYGIRSVPANFLIDENGKVIASGLRGQLLDQKLRKIFAEKRR